jgi:hypothetical protein
MITASWRNDAGIAKRFGFAYVPRSSAPQAPSARA